MTDYTKSTHATDARGNKVRVEFVKSDGDNNCFKVLDPHEFSGGARGAGVKWWFYDDGDSDIGLTLCPPEPEEPPVWALKRACEEAGVNYQDYRTMVLVPRLRASIRAHAITLADHEEEPVDPVLTALLDGASNAYKEFGEVWPGTVIIAKRQMEKLQERGIDLAKAGDA